MVFSTFPICRQNLNIWKDFFYLYWAVLLCLSACSTFLVFLTDDIQLLWLTTILHFWLPLTIWLISFLTIWRSTLEVHTASATLTLAAPETTPRLRTLWPVLCQNWLWFWMQNPELNSCWPVLCPEMLPPVYLYKLHPESRFFGTWANFMLGHDIIYMGATEASH